MRCGGRRSQWSEMSSLLVSLPPHCCQRDQSGGGREGSYISCYSCLISTIMTFDLKESMISKAMKQLSLDCYNVHMYMHIYMYVPSVHTSVLVQLLQLDQSGGEEGSKE